MAQVRLNGNAYTIYDESNAHTLVNQVAGRGGSFGAGFETASMGGFGSVCGIESVVNIPRSQWVERTKEREAKKGFPSHWFERGKVEILDQDRWGYCWIYGVGGAMQTAYAMQGIKAPHLNPFPTGYRGKNGRNVGGWAGEAIGYIEQYGMPTADAFPSHSTNQADFRSQKYLDSAKKHKIAHFTELPRNSYDALVSHLLGPNPSPVTLGLTWWGHLIYATAVVVTGSTVGILIVNSWRKTWGNQGKAVLAESKATAAEQIAVRAVKPR